MSRLTIEERFTLPAPPERAWLHLTDPERTVQCLPGAELVEVVDDRTYRGTVTVQVGPVTVVYEGEAVFEELDADARFMKLTAEGRESRGSGSASMVMESRIVPSEDGAASEVTVEAEVEVAGKIVRFGRGMIERVSAEIFKEFTTCLAGRVEAEGADGDAEAGGEDAEPTEGADGPTDGESPDAGSREAAAKPAPGPARPASGLTYVWRALVTWLRELFGGGDEPPRSR